jgi:hypothetical protein
VSLQLLGVPGVPLKVTVLVPWVAPKPEPVIPSNDPTANEGLSMLVIDGGTITVNETPLLSCAPALTTTFPVMAPLGTLATICVSLQLVGVAAILPADPWKVMLPPFWVAPKLVPATVTEVPTCPEEGVRLIIAGVSVKLAELGTPEMVTTTGLDPGESPLGKDMVMLVLLQLLGVVTMPPTVTLVVP